VLRSNRWLYGALQPFYDSGLGIGQIMKWDKQPAYMQASAYYNVETPDNGADWQLRLQGQLMFPKQQTGNTVLSG